MQLKSIRVQNYKCIDDSDEFSVRELTCLAGKNEAGKTALLQALRRLNPVEKTEANFDSLMEYPRRRRHNLEKGGTALEALTTEWELSEADVKSLENVLGPGVITNLKVTVKRGYDNKTDWSYSIDEKAVINFLISQTPNLTNNAKERILACKDVTSLYRSVKSSVKPTKGEEEIKKQIERFAGNSSKEESLKILQSLLPRFLYFPTYGTLPGKISDEQINQTENKNLGVRLFRALLDLAGTEHKGLGSLSRYEELKASLEIVSNRLSDEIFEYWKQNLDLKVEFDYREALADDPPPFNSGHVFSLRVENTRHRVSVGFDERSAGFVWFFSFLVWFSQMEKEYGHRLIILLDEPGLSLHGKAQADLLRYMKEKLVPKYQVLYTTHSPFMIDSSNLLSVRTVEDVVTKEDQTLGTKVGDKVLSADADTLFPLRAALGYDITQSLFIGEYSLLVEGPSDLLFLKWASRRLVAEGRVGLDPRWTITPAGGIDKLGSFVALFAGNEIQVAILTDFHSGDKGKVEDLRQSKILEASRVFTAESYTDQSEADIEDMIGRDLYVELVNQCYELRGEARLPAKRPSSAPKLILKEIKHHFRTVAIEGPEFDHLSPAIYLVEHESAFLNALGAGKAIDRFEEFFEAVNNLLPSLRKA